MGMQTLDPTRARRRISRARRGHGSATNRDVGPVGKVFRTKRCAGRCRYARMASMLKKLTSQDLERYFKKWFLKHFQLNRVGGLIAHDGGRGEQAGDTGSVVSTEASPLGEVRMVCCTTPVFLPGESPWTEEPGWLQSMGSHMTGSSGSLSCGAREVRCPCAWRGGTGRLTA